MKRQNQIYVPPSVFAGELIVHKGYYWRVQAFSHNGGEVALTDENGTQRGIAQNACIVLERYKKTSGTEKREAKAAKRASRKIQRGYRPKTLCIDDYSPVVLPTGSTIVAPTEEDIKRVG